MAEEKPKNKIPGWIKAAFTSMLGIVSGAALMYITPLVNNVIKPAKPVPNFSQQISGLTVTFNNRSTGGTQGWWDFGDGSALEPYEPGKDTLSHAYARPGNYNVKLSLQNLLGEEVDRTVAVNLENSQSAPPIIEAFTVVPVDPNNKSAPATFKILSQVKNAKVIAFDMGSSDIKIETSPSIERLVTLPDPGDYTLRLVAFNGDQVVQQTKHVFVEMYSAKPQATLKVVYDGVQVDRIQRNETIVLAWDPKHQGATCPVKREWAAPAGWMIADAKYDAPSKDVIRNLSATSPDRTHLLVTGELIKPKNVLLSKIAAPQCAVRLEMTLERRSAAVSKTMDAVTFDLNAPGSTAMPLPPLPPGMLVQAKRIALEIKDGSKMVWNGAGLPQAAAVAMQNRAMRVTAVEQGDQLRIDVVTPNAALPVSRPGG